MGAGHPPHPKLGVAHYNQAMMDMGATVCTRSKPACERCPVREDCQGLSQGNPTAYPNSKPKKSIPARTGIMLLIRHGDQLLLEKRPPQGIWGGLYCFPRWSRTPKWQGCCSSSA